MKRHCLLCVGLAIVLAMPASGQEEKLLRPGLIEVLADESQEPPGDVIRIRPIAFGLIEPVLSRVTVRPMRLTGDGVEVRPVPIREGDGAETTVETAIGPRPGKSTVDVVVPFASIGLEPGVHRLTYRVTVAAAGRVQYVQYSKPAVVLVGELRRIPVLGKREVPITRNVEVAAEIMKNGVRETVKRTETRTEILYEKADTGRFAEVPGGYRRLAEYQGQPWDDRQDRSLATVGRRRIVHWTTTRKPNPGPAPRRPADFSNVTDSRLWHGVVEVALPADHRTGDEVVEPGWFVGRGRAYQISAWSNLSPQNFYRLLGGENSKHDLLIFVHGYNTPFQFAVFKAAQFATDIGFQGKVIVFSWASQGSVRKFDADLVESANAAPMFQQFLRELKLARDREAEQGRVHLLAHSMGSRVVCRAVGDPNAQPGQFPPLANLILAAAEIDVAEYDSLYPMLMQRSKRHSSYFHSRDRALTVAKDFHHTKAIPPNPSYRPVGDREYLRAPAPCCQNVECNAASLDVMGLLHGYYATSIPVLEDIGLMVARDLDAERRPLHKIDFAGLAYWAIAP